jgi:hypothetical protein
MTGRRIGRAAALAALLFSVGCCSWCERACPHTQAYQPCAPGYQPSTCCTPAPVCCPPPSNYPAQPTQPVPPNWSQPRGGSPCP